MPKIITSDETNELVCSSATICDDREFGTDPFDILAALEDQYGLPMNTKVEQMPSTRPMKATPRVFTVGLSVAQPLFVAKQINAKAEPISLEAIETARIRRLMSAPKLANNFTNERVIPVATNLSKLPAPAATKTMTYDEAYDEATIACWEITGSPDNNGAKWDRLHDKLLDALCIKHNIKN